MYHLEICINAPLPNVELDLEQWGNPSTRILATRTDLYEQRHRLWNAFPVYRCIGDCVCIIRFDIIRYGQTDTTKSLTNQSCCQYRRKRGNIYSVPLDVIRLVVTGITPTSKVWHSRRHPAMISEGKRGSVGVCYLPTLPRSGKNRVLNNFHNLGSSGFQ